MFLGVDIGTSAVKALVLDETGSVVASSQAGHRRLSPSSLME